MPIKSQVWMDPKIATKAFLIKKNKRDEIKAYAALFYVLCWTFQTCGSDIAPLHFKQLC